MWVSASQLRIRRPRGDLVPCTTRTTNPGSARDPTPLGDQGSAADGGDLLTARPRAARPRGGVQGGTACLAPHLSARQDFIRAARRSPPRPGRVAGRRTPRPAAVLQSPTPAAPRVHYGRFVTESVTEAPSSACSRCTTDTGAGSVTSAGRLTHRRPVPLQGDGQGLISPRFPGWLRLTRTFTQLWVRPLPLLRSRSRSATSCGLSPDRRRWSTVRLPHYLGQRRRVMPSDFSKATRPMSDQDSPASHHSMISRGHPLARLTPLTGSPSGRWSQLRCRSPVNVTRPSGESTYR